MNLNSSEIKISSDVLRTWQRIVDLLAQIVHVPSAVVCQLELPHGTHYRIVASCNSEANPFPIDQEFPMDIGTFCETVIKSRERLLVANALEDDRWKLAPEIRVGMISYLGLPVVWPDGQMFGTICVLDDKANQYSELYQELLLHCRDVLQADLRMLVRFGNELEDQRTHLTELFARIPEAVVLVDPESKITRINPEFTNIFGYSVEESIGKKLKELIVPDDLHEEAEDIIVKMRLMENPFPVETVRKRKNGMRVPVSLICVPLPSSRAENAGYLIYRDISEAKRLQDQQRRYHEIQLELAQANRVSTLGLLSASIAHELNQPLSGIITNCEVSLRMLARDAENVNGAQEAMRRAIRDGQRASEVIARLRALFGRKQPELEPVDLNEAAAEVIGLSLDEIEDSRIFVQTDFAEGLQQIMADRVQLQQVILNLVRNALDAMSTVHDRPRSLIIRTEREECDSLRLSVKDVGVGFDPGEADKIFDAFYSTKHNGMGVGLSMSNFIIESHRGRLWADLNDGPGATFSFSIPYGSSE